MLGDGVSIRIVLVKIRSIQDDQVCIRDQGNFLAFEDFQCKGDEALSKGVREVSD